MDCTPTQQKRKSQSCLTLKCSVIVSYIVSITSNILLTVILYLSDHGYKWFGYVFHTLVLACSFLSLKHLLTFSSKNLLRYKSMTKYYSLNLIVTAVFLKIKIYYFTFCILIWCIFHGLFISIINSFIRTLEDRPAQKGSNVKMIDKNLRDLMLSSNTGNM